ncbi:5-formyltetrahydrofolate cyclo-ligase [Pyrolobus fumarii 1A]|uniref:5-formyltetrahydrofolate cyclo-ligase n=1 Tax=Pyrolobus fumarii (strain DSM 11204 / 1A) TaxID=694429 RepID=G0EEB1_PYRF1|nr:5-formyltetrahydrofolate cyclo-ligase [Pyrolobus fumarii]AEM38805.1 5-formyltetrahydrofolate cyclo-ligase [Pyrolobus fumarii 1A]
MDNPKEVKRRIRERIWKLLEEKGVAAFPRPVYGRIPNFVGAERAAERLFETPEWRKARIVKVNPDAPQRLVRLRALQEAKLLIMATPRMREGFLLLDPRLIPPRYYAEASTIRGAFRWGRRLTLDELARLKIDLIVTGSVAVDREGNRVGKGEGYAELEYAVLREIGAVTPETPVATTVHDLQIVDSIPREPYDLTVDIIATPTRLHRVEPKPPKPQGILWNRLPDEKLREIPLLRELKEKLRR